MRWLADECVAAPLVARLREAGLDVTYMAEIAPAATDPEAIARAHHEGRLLLTEDKDFGELVFRWNWPEALAASTNRTAFRSGIDVETL